MVEAAKQGELKHLAELEKLGKKTTLVE